MLVSMHPPSQSAPGTRKMKTMRTPTSETAMRLSSTRCAAFLMALWRMPPRRLSLSLAALILSLAFASGHAAGAPARTAAAAETPQAVLAEFYPWYLGEMMKGRVPLTEEKIRDYIAEDTLRDIAFMMNRPNGGKRGLLEDYFIHAKDFFDDWADHVAVSEVMIDGDAALALVMLGDPAQGTQRLALTLVREGNAWKISRVNEAGAQQ
jgi:uncharacterized protein DUF3828